MLEGALTDLLREPITVTAAGRTDGGVHASGQVISFTTHADFPFARLAIAANAVLPADCSVRDAVIEDDEFSARFSALERTYVYVVYNAPQRSALAARYAHHVARPLDVEAMRAAAAPLVGEHDFRSFAAAGDAAGSVRVVRAVTIQPHGGLIAIEISADGFLHHMVRTIVGTLVECGAERRDARGVAAVLAAKNRAAAGTTAPARGLCLAGVRYAGG